MVNQTPTTVHWDSMRQLLLGYDLDRTDDAQSYLQVCTEKKTSDLLLCQVKLFSYNSLPTMLTNKSRKTQ